jgi:hypothetical protein
MKMNARELEKAMDKYLTKLPAAVPAHKVLVHNHVLPPVRTPNLRGFRVWLDEPDADKYEACGCAWAPELGEHFRAKQPWARSNRINQITEAVMHLGQLCGMGKSESDSEAFVTQLSPVRRRFSKIFTPHKRKDCAWMRGVRSRHIFLRPSGKKKRAPNRKPSARSL